VVGRLVRNGTARVTPDRLRGGGLENTYLESAIVFGPIVKQRTGLLNPIEEISRGVSVDAGSPGSLMP